MSKIVYCQATYLERKAQTLEGLKRIEPYVDRCVIIGPEPKEEWPELERFKKVEYYQEEWRDDFVEYRNKYLEKLESGSWAVVSDPDEWFCSAFCRDLQKIVEEAEERGIGLLLINSHDITEMPDGTVRESTSDFFKNLIFKYVEGMRYSGVGIGRVHETLNVPPGTKTVSLPRQYYYEHRKTQIEVWERAFRNVYCAGGGNNVGNRNPRWGPLLQITKELGLKSWPEVREYLRKGDINKKLLDWIRDCQHESGWDWQNEMFDCLKYYRAIHGEELPDIPPAMELKLPAPSPGSPPEVMHYVEEIYQKVLGRHADDRGKQQYTSLILAGRINRDDLPQILMQSTEYKEKFGAPEVPSAAVESVKLQVPIDVNVRITEDLYVKALMRSKLWDETFKPRLDLGKFIEEHVKDKESFYKEFYRALNLEKFSLRDLVRLLTDRAR